MLSAAQALFVFMLFTCILAVIALLAVSYREKGSVRRFFRFWPRTLQTTFHKLALPAVTSLCSLVVVVVLVQRATLESMASTMTAYQQALPQLLEKSLDRLVGWRGAIATAERLDNVGLRPLSFSSVICYGRDSITSVGAVLLEVAPGRRDYVYHLSFGAITQAAGASSRMLKSITAETYSAGSAVRPLVLGTRQVNDTLDSKHAILRCTVRLQGQLGERVILRYVAGRKTDADGLVRGYFYDPVLDGVVDTLQRTFCFSSQLEMKYVAEFAGGSVDVRELGQALGSGWRFEKLDGGETELERWGMQSLEGSGDCYRLTVLKAHQPFGVLMVERDSLMRRFGNLAARDEAVGRNH